MEQPFANGSQLPPTPPKNWLVESILATIFCCMPLGIVGIVFASQVNTRFAAGDYAGALRASKDAGRFAKLSFFISIGLAILGLLFLFVFGGWALLRNRYDY